MTEPAEDTIEQDVHGLSTREMCVLRSILKVHQVTKFGSHPIIDVYHSHVRIYGILAREELDALSTFMAVRANDSTLRA